MYTADNTIAARKHEEYILERLCKCNDAANFIATHPPTCTVAMSIPRRFLLSVLDFLPKVLDFLLSVKRSGKGFHRELVDEWVCPK